MAQFPKPERLRVAEYLAFVREVGRERGCLVCGNRAVEAAHVNLLHDKGLGSKAPDIFALPLCADHHRGTDGLDTVGQAKFEARTNLDLAREALRLIAEFTRRRL